MKIYDNTGGDVKVTLRQAILIYQTETNGRTSWLAPSEGCVATVHPVSDNIIGPGTVAGQDAVRQLASDLIGRTTGVELLPPNVLGLSFECMIWHRPASKARLWFQPAGKDKTNKALKKVSGEFFPQPHLIFMAGSGFFNVFAIQPGARPNARTMLYQAPYWNVNGRGRLCVGSTRFPKHLLPSAIPAFEEGFFKSRFTHSTAGTGIVRSGHSELWPTLVNKRRFPNSELIPMSVNIPGLRQGKVRTRKVLLGEMLRFHS